MLHIEMNIYLSIYYSI